VLSNIATGKFHFDFLLAALAFLFWIRFMSMLQLTATFGPIIRICFKMLYDMATFFCIFFLQITAFACVGVLTFGEIPEYNSLYTSIVMIFQTAMG
jgi:hypothetical protein